MKKALLLCVALCAIFAADATYKPGYYDRMEC